MVIKGVARRLFKSRHNMIEERSLGVKAPVESKLEGVRVKGIGMDTYATGRHIFKFVEMKVSKPFFLSLSTCLVEPKVATPLVI